jgi:hypothetical protein
MNWISPFSSTAWRTFGLQWTWACSKIPCEAVSKSANVHKTTLDSIGEQTPTNILTTRHDMLFARSPSLFEDVIL